jgi:hypothetical protein
MSGEHAELDELQAAYKNLVEVWIAAIRKEEALASVNHDVADVDKWMNCAIRSRRPRRNTKTPFARSSSGSKPEAPQLCGAFLRLSPWVEITKPCPPPRLNEGQPPPKVDGSRFLFASGGMGGKPGNLYQPGGTAVPWLPGTAAKLEATPGRIMTWRVR